MADLPKLQALTIENNPAEVSLDCFRRLDELGLCALPAVGKHKSTISLPHRHSSLPKILRRGACDFCGKLLGQLARSHQAAELRRQGAVRRLQVLQLRLQ